jgi:hypothetical protein
MELCRHGMTLTKQEIIQKLKEGWRASGNYDKLEAFDLVSPSYGGATPRITVPASMVRELVREGFLRRPPVGIGKAFMESV